MSFRNTLLTAFILAAASAAAACRSDKHGESDAEFPCICGTPEAALESCLHSSCAAGETNPDNPDCACGTLSFGKEGE